MAATGDGGTWRGVCLPRRQVAPVFAAFTPQPARSEVVAVYADGSIVWHPTERTLEGNVPFAPSLPPDPSGGATTCAELVAPSALGVCLTDIPSAQVVGCRGTAGGIISVFSQRNPGAVRWEVGQAHGAVAVAFAGLAFGPPGSDGCIVTVAMLDAGGSAFVLSGGGGQVPAARCIVEGSLLRGRVRAVAASGDGVWFRGARRGAGVHCASIFPGEEKAERATRFGAQGCLMCGGDAPVALAASEDVVVAACGTALFLVAFRSLGPGGARSPLLRGPRGAEKLCSLPAAAAALALAPERDVVVAGCADGAVRLVNLHTGDIVTATVAAAGEAPVRVSYDWTRNVVVCVAAGVVELLQPPAHALAAVSRSLAARGVATRCGAFADTPQARVLRQLVVLEAGLPDEAAGPAAKPEPPAEGALQAAEAAVSARWVVPEDVQALCNPTHLVP